MSAALRSFLEHPSRPAAALSYHELQGFLFAVASAPELIAPSEWMPMVFGEDEAAFARHEEAETILAALMQVYNDVNGGVYEGRAALPADCEFRADVLANFEDDAPVGHWSRGFLRGYQWLEKTWEQYVIEELDEEFAALLVTLTFFASRTLAAGYCRELGDRTVSDLAPAMREAFPEALRQFARLGRGIQQVLWEAECGPVRRSRERIGRNEPCPCGSGRKYKRCCGA